MDETLTQQENKIVRFVKNIIAPNSFKTFFLFSITIFFASLLFGILISFAQPEEVYNRNFEAISDKVTEHIDWSSNFSVMIGILKNNIRVGLIIYILALLLTSAPAYLIYITNGAVVGYVLAKHLNLKAIMLILPHGIIEIPGIIVFGYAGARYNLLTNYFFSENGQKIELRQLLLNSIKVFMLGVSILAISAFIEAYITLNIAQMF